MITLLERLSSEIAVSGCEKSLSALIKKEIEPYCDRVYTDKIGNLIAEKKGKKESKNKVLVAAHVDEVGFIITDITESGLLRFETVGGIDARLLPAKNVTICTKNGLVNGVVGIVPMHLLKGDEKKAVKDADSFYIDIGVFSKTKAQALVCLGDVGVLDGEFKELGNGKIISRALDNRCGCSVLINLLKCDAEYDFTAVFTVQEEIGCRGAQVTAQNLKPDVSLILDTTTACDINGIPDDSTVCSLGNGGVVSFMDKGCLYDRELYSLLLDCAKESSISAQTKRAVAGANDSSSIHKAAGGVRCASLCVPCRYLHSGICMIDKKDLQSTLELASKVLPRLCSL